MKIILAGGSGQVGGLLARAFHSAGDEVVVFSRQVQPHFPFGRVVHWDGRSPGPWMKEIEGCDVLVGLAGRSVNCRYTAKNRELIKNSRVQSVRVLGQAVAAASRPPAVWLQASTATIYQHTFAAANGENGPLGGAEPGVPETWRFSIDVATAWEQETLLAGPLLKTRTVLLRSAMTMSPDPGGVFDAFLRLVRLGLGGRMGDGQQFVSWIHEVDFVRAVRWILTHDHLAGPINLSAPEPLSNSEFMWHLREAWGAPVGLPAPAFLIEMGTWLFRTESELVLKSRRVVPTRLLEDGFRFDFTSWPSAAVDLCRRWREGR